MSVFASPGGQAVAQTTPVAPTDSTHKYESTAPAHARPWYQGKLVRATVVPAILIGYGVSTINGRGFYSSYDARRDIHRFIGPGRHTRVDDYLLVAPYLELGGVLLAGVESRNDRVNLGLIILKSELLMGASVYAIKTLTQVTRPDGTATSFPSGHTAQAFLAASIVHTELRDHSQWYGIGAYTIAGSVGILRMVNDRHWESDVFAGAGIGILSAHLAYLSHRHRWGRKPLEARAALRVAPSYYAGTMGLSLQWQAQ